MEREIMSVTRKALENAFCETCVEEVDGKLFVTDEDSNIGYVINIETTD